MEIAASAEVARRRVEWAEHMLSKHKRNAVPTTYMWTMRRRELSELKVANTVSRLQRGAAVRNLERLGQLVYAECFRAWRRYMHTRRRRERAAGSLLQHWHKDGDNLKHRFQRWRDLCRDKYHGDSPLDTALNRQRALELVNGRLKQRLADDAVTISAMRETQAQLQSAVNEAAAQELGREYSVLANAKVEAEANSKALRAKLAVLAQFALLLSDDSLNPLDDHVRVRAPSFAQIRFAPNASLTRASRRPSSQEIERWLPQASRLMELRAGPCDDTVLRARLETDPHGLYATP